MVDLPSIEFPGPPSADRRVAELVRPIDDGFVRDVIPFALNAHPVAIPGNIPFIFHRLSVRCVTAALTGLVLQSLDPNLSEA